MAKQTMIDTTLLAGNASEAIDLSGYANSLEFSESAEEVDATTIEDTVRRRIASLKDAAFNFKCADDDSGQPWDTLQDLFGAADCQFAWISSNASMAEGDIGVMVQALESSYERGGDVGSLKEISVSGNGDGPMIWSKVLQQDESLASTGQSTGFQYGSVAAGETMYAKCFCLSLGGGSIQVDIESDDNSGFTSATQRISLASQSSVSTVTGSVAGAITDDWWRANYTIVTGPAVVVVMIGKK